MNIKKALMDQHNKQQATKIAYYASKDQKRVEELLYLFLSTEYIIAQRAAWPVGILAEANPSIIYPYLNALVENLKNPVHDAVKRNTIRIFQNIELPDKLLGKIADQCFHYLSTPSEPIAVKVFSMTVLLNIVKKEPDLKKELKILIEDQLPYASAGFLSRAKKVLKALDKI